MKYIIYVIVTLYSHDIKDVYIGKQGVIIKHWTSEIKIDTLTKEYTDLKKFSISLTSLEKQLDWQNSDEILPYIRDENGAPIGASITEIDSIWYEIKTIEK